MSYLVPAVNWWKGTLTPRPTVDWYMNKLDFSMQVHNSEKRETSSGLALNVIKETGYEIAWFSKTSVIAEMDKQIGADTYRLLYM
jgi:hypothetical protein